MVISGYYHANGDGQARPEAGRPPGALGPGSEGAESDVIRALIDRAGPIETGDDLIEWIELARGRGLGLAQQDSRKNVRNNARNNE